MYTKICENFVKIQTKCLKTNEFRERKLYNIMYRQSFKLKHEIFVNFDENNVLILYEQEN